MKPEEFVKEYFYDAFKSKINTGVPVLVTLAQAALESGWGRYAKGNNFFGIKAGTTWKGATQKLKTTEYVGGKKIRVDAKFRKYETPAESFTDHGELLKKRWGNSFVHSDPIDFIVSVQTDYPYKYATDPDYVEKIAKLVRRIKKLILEIKKINI